MMTSLIWILVFPWIQVLAQTCLSSYSLPMRLQGHVIKAYSALQTSEQCINKCALHADCHSINYYSNKGICEVNNANHLTNPESLVYSAGFKYLNYFLRAVSRCSNKLCRSPHYCAIDSTTEQGYKCPRGNIVLSFPRKDSNKDKVSYTLNVVDLKAFTVSMWVQVDSSKSGHTPFNYIAAGGSKEMVVFLNTGICEFYINGDKLTYPQSLLDDRWHHVCVTWEKEEGNISMYIDGIKKKGQTNFKDGYTIKKGTVFLGQGAHHFQGNLTGVNMWDRVLTAQEVSAINITGRCSSSQGNVIKWADLQDKSGNVKVINEPFCT